MLLLSNGMPVDRGATGYQMAVRKEVDLVKFISSQLNDRKNRCLQNEINAL